MKTTAYTEKELLEAYDLLIGAEAILQRGNMKEAYLAFEQIKAQYPLFAPVHNHLAWYSAFYLSDYTRAEKEYHKAIKLDPNYPHTWFNYASMLVNLEQYSKAIKLLEQACGIATVNKARVYNELGRIHELTGCFDQAIECYRKAIQQVYSAGELDEYENDLKRCQHKKKLLSPSEVL